jgi:hypothetical protein
MTTQACRALQHEDQAELMNAHCDKFTCEPICGDLIRYRRWWAPSHSEWPVFSHPCASVTRMTVSRSRSTNRKRTMRARCAHFTAHASSPLKLGTAANGLQSASDMPIPLVSPPKKNELTSPGPARPPHPTSLPTVSTADVAISGIRRGKQSMQLNLLCEATRQPF